MQNNDGSVAWVCPADGTSFIITVAPELSGKDGQSDNSSDSANTCVLTPKVGGDFLLLCADGSSFTIPQKGSDGQNGQNGANGQNGQDGLTPYIGNNATGGSAITILA